MPTLFLSSYICYRDEALTRRIGELEFADLMKPERVESYERQEMAPSGNIAALNAILFERPLTCVAKMALEA
jgi:hypothetical protein